jgi:hypothetical protein
MSSEKTKQNPESEADKSRKAIISCVPAGIESQFTSKDKHMSIVNFGNGTFVCSYKNSVYHLTSEGTITKMIHANKKVDTTMTTSDPHIIAALSPSFDRILEQYKEEIQSFTVASISKSAETGKTVETKVLKTLDEDPDVDSLGGWSVDNNS